MRKMLQCLLTLVMAGALMTQAAAITQWTVIELQTLPDGTRSFAWAINERGQVVGASENASGASRSVLWNPPFVSEIGGLPGGTHSTATGINNAGQVVGLSEVQTADGVVYHAFLWQHGTMTDLGPPEGSRDSYAYGINERGDIVGAITSWNGDWRPVLWRDGVLVTLELPPDAVSGAAWAINNRGQVAGDANFPDGNTHPVFWHQGKIRDVGLPPSPGGSYAPARDVNNRGQLLVEGSSGYLWKAGTWTELLPLSSSFGTSLVTALNDRGQVVGGSPIVHPDDPTLALIHAALWDRGAVVDLGALVPGLSTMARAINNGGQVVGERYDFNGPEFEPTRAVLWTRR